MGGAGTSRWGEVGDMGDLVTCAEEEEREGAGVRGGGGEQVVTGVVTVEDGEGPLSRRRGFGVRRGGEGVTEEAGAGPVEGEGSGGEGCCGGALLGESFGSGWLWRTPASRSMVQQGEDCDNKKEPK